MAEGGVSLESVIFKLEGDLTDLRRAMRQGESTVRGSSNKIDRSMKRVGNSMSRAAASAKLFAGALVGITGVVALRNTVRTIASFEKSMSGVKAVTGATDEAMREMNKTARELGATTAFTASEAGSAMEFLGRAGFDANQILATVGDTLNLAAAGSLDLGRAADIASNVLTGFRLEVDQMGRVTDVMAAGAASANTNIEQMGEALKFAAPVAAEFGVSIETSAAAVGVLSNAGLQASLAGTGLRRVLAELASPSKKLQKFMGDANLETDGLVGVMQKLRKSSLDGSDALEIFGQRGGPAFSVLKAGVVNLTDLDNAMRDVQGRAKAMADIMLDNLNGAIIEFKSAVEGLQISLGEGGLSQVIRNVAVEWTGWLREVIKLNDALSALDRVELGLTLKDRAIVISNELQSVREQIELIDKKLKGTIQFGGNKDNLKEERIELEKQVKVLEQREKIIIGEIARQDKNRREQAARLKAAKDKLNQPAGGKKSKGLGDDLQEAVDALKGTPLEELEGKMAELVKLADDLNTAFVEGDIEENKFNRAIKNISTELQKVKDEFDAGLDSKNTVKPRDGGAKDVADEKALKEFIRVQAEIEKAQLQIRTLNGEFANLPAGFLEAAQSAGLFNEALAASTLSGEKLNVNLVDMLDKFKELREAQIAKEFKKLSDQQKEQQLEVTRLRDGWAQLEEGVLAAARSMGLQAEVTRALDSNFTDLDGKILALNQRFREMRVISETSEHLRNIQTPLEVYEEQIQRITTLNDEYVASNGRIGLSLEEANKALVKANEAYVASDKTLSMLKGGVQDFGRVIGTAFEDAVLRAESAKDVLKGLLEDIQRILFRVFVTTQIQNAITGGLGGLMGPSAPSLGGANLPFQSSVSRGVLLPSAKGNAFGPRGLHKFAKGGLTKGPTMFPFARGVGLMGEAGTEGILPLARDKGGRLGVRSQGGGGGVTYMIDARGSNGEESIRQAIAEAIAQASPGIVNASVLRTVEARRNNPSLFR